eukprot:TRINITY_DN29329_c0_g1_i1.p1 TRINITY_DN29329_c0_g1~~TRINITY_DN29329_c0_g1_i1.p1  ORF type:complete len:198 (-),score=114.40 TRINITY_DN29329_c0_g1_i1:42-575(-)
MTSVAMKFDERLQGTWKLDLEATKGMDDLLKVIGKPWILRQVMKRTAPVQTLSFENEGGLIRMHFCIAGIINVDKQQRTDGEYRDDEDGFVTSDRVLTAAEWVPPSADSEHRRPAIRIHKKRFKLSSGDPAEFHLVRFLDADDADLTIVDLRLVVAKRSSKQPVEHKVRQYFRRQQH